MKLEKEGGNMTSAASAPSLAKGIYAMVSSRLDYCNLLYVGIPLRVTQKLQLIQKVAVQIVMGMSQIAYVEPMLCQLYWLLMKYLVRFKMLTFKALSGLGPT